LGLHVVTPQIESLALSRAGTRRVWLKLEALQPCGSFKARGIGHLCELQKARGCRRFVSSSGGNAGLAVAYSGRQLGVPVTVVVPETTGARARGLIAAEGAEVIVHGQSWQEAHDHALSLMAADAQYIHPFDDPLIWEGHASLVDELPRKPDAIVLSVGGGGLLAGVAHGLARRHWNDVALIAAETLGCDSFAQSVAAGSVIELARISSIATTLGAKRVCTRAFEVSREFRTHPLVVSDLDALRACLQFADDHRLVVEPACGASLALLYRDAPVLAAYREIVVIVCGGAGVSYRELATLEAELAARSSNFTDSALS
jgi:L-serine/L-threonine ammonia-lyase